MHWSVYLLIVAATLVMPFLLGSYFSRMLRMPEYAWKISIILFTFLASVMVLLFGPPLKLGVDLRGGVILVYEIDKSNSMPGQSFKMDELVAAISKRVNPGGQKEVTIRPAGADQVEIIIPEVDDAEVARVEKIISRAGTLEFRIVANSQDHKDLIERAQALPTSTKIVKNAAGEVKGWWAPVQAGQERTFARDIQREVTRGGKKVMEVLVASDDQNVTGAYLTRADREYDPQTGPCVSFSFDSTGAQLFGQLTGANLPNEVQNFKRKLGILLDGELYSAPEIRSRITDRGQITGGDSSIKSVDDQVNVLKAGRLPAALTKEPISRLYSGPTLGQDTITKSSHAMIIACILVPLFMLWYYRFAGLVANIALVLNMLILVALMVALKAAFTLTGLAGLALTVGMAVDNNVLVYERLREERERGATLRMAIRNAFHRASATIIDCNVSHLIAAIVLWVVGTDQIRGFAVTLGLGVTISMFTSVFVARVIFEIADKQQWLKQLKMMHLIRHTNIDFMSWFPLCATASILITVVGLWVAWQRGQGLFDIDFTGGVSVQAQFNEPQDTGYVRSALGELPEADRLPDLAVSDVQVAGEKKGLRFVINTSEPSLDRLQKELAKVFADKLARNELTFTEPTLIESAANKAADAKTAEAGKPAEDKPAEATVFAGGAESKLTFKTPLDIKAVEDLLHAAVEKEGVGDSRTQFHLSSAEYVEGEKRPLPEWTVTTELPPDKAQVVLAAVQEQLSQSPFFPASSTIGGAVAKNTQVIAVYALIASWSGIIIYLWIRFQGVAFGLAAVLSLVHDVLVMLGAVALSFYLVKWAPWLAGPLMIEPFKINLPIIAAFLTIVGYSVNDTIVVFDRIREVRGKDPNMTRKMVNDSTNQTMSRTLLTSVTVLLVVVVLYIAGGDALHGFAFSLIIGVVTGTYSSIYVAAPTLLWLLGHAKNHGEPAANK